MSCPTSSMGNLTSAKYRDAFIRAIVEDPRDLAIRLIFADYLEENGEVDRASFVRVQIAIATCQRCDGDGLAHGADRPFEWSPSADYGKCVVCFPLRHREWELLREGWTHWYSIGRQAPVVCWNLNPDKRNSGVFTITFRRGFVEQVSCSYADWLKHGPAIVRAQPVTQVKLSKPYPSVGPFFHYIDGHHLDPIPWARGPHPALGLTALPPVQE